MSSPDPRTRAPASGRRDASAPLPDTPRSVAPGRGWLLALTVVSIGLLVLLSVGLLLVERQTSLDRAESQAQREVLRLAAELDQSLRLAQAAVNVAEGAAIPTDLLQDHKALVQALNLPFELNLVPPDDLDAATLPVNEWIPALARKDKDDWLLPMRWRQTPDAGGKVYEVTLSRRALLERFSSEDMPMGSSMSLFRIEDDGATTVLARYPLIEEEQGKTLRGHLAQAVAQTPSGVFQAEATLDGIHRTVGYHRLDGTARRLMIVYALGTEGVLALWHAVLPWAVLLTLLVATAMGVGAWRLDRSVHALRRSELRFRLAASQGQVWEWDFERSTFAPNDNFFAYLGLAPPPPGKTEAALFEQVHPEDLPRLRLVMRRYLRQEGEYQLEFRAKDAQGRYHWFNTSGSGIRDARGRVTYMAGTTFDISDRKALEESQRQMLAHLETVANASPALFWSSTVDGKCDWVNQSWLDFTGRSLAEETGNGWIEGVHPDDRAPTRQHYLEAFDAREPFSLEYRLRQLNGQYRWMLVHGKPRYDADNRFVGYIGSCLDVTDLKHAEQTARDRGAMLEQVFGVLQDMLFVVDEQERYVFFKAGQTDKLYQPPEKFLHRHIEDVMPEPMVQLTRSAMAQAKTGGLQEFNYSMELPVGKRHFNVRLAWLPDQQLCMFVVRDTTAQQEISMERERMNRFVLLLFRLASRFINLPVQQMDKAINSALGDVGAFVNADRSYLFTYDMAAGTTSNTHEWCAPDISPQIASLQNISLAMIPDWTRAHRFGQRLHVPDVQALPEGDLKVTLQAQGIRSLMTLPLMQGLECLGFVGLDSVRDVHEYAEEEVVLLELFAQMLVNMKMRARTETRVNDLTEQLEQKVTERTAQLEASVGRLQAVNRELETFTYSASHDLRTPLRGIEGFSALLLAEHADQLDEQGREYLHRIQRATLHMSQLISDLLAYARLEQMTERVESVQLSALIADIAQPFKDSIRERQGHLTLSVPEDLRVMADPRGLSMAMRNLLDNALKFTPTGRPPDIRIDATQERDLVHLRVTDNGQGFDMKYHDRIFGMFQRLHRQDQIPGTGVGLALVTKAIERMGGRIWAESTPGQGSTFHIQVATRHRSKVSTQSAPVHSPS